MIAKISTQWHLARGRKYTINFAKSLEKNVIVIKY
jgi:hypothetical protein